MIPGVPLRDLGHNCHRYSLSAMIIEKPEALFSDEAHIFPIRAWVCASCGFAGFYVDDPQGWLGLLSGSWAGGNSLMQPMPPDCR